MDRQEYGLSWSDSRTGDYEIYLTRLDAAGNKIDGDVRSTFHTGTSTGVSIVWIAGEYGVFWYDDRIGVGDAEIFFNRAGCASIDGDADGAPLSVDCDDADDRIGPTTPQVCDDGLNNDCNHSNWPSLAGTNETDNDGDGLSECAGDCDGADPDLWAPPGETRDLRFTSKVILQWTAPLNPGGIEDPLYDLIRSSYDASGFADPLVSDCLVYNATDTTANEYYEPYAGEGILYYLVRATNACPAGNGSLGTDSEGAERPGPELCF